MVFYQNTTIISFLPTLSPYCFVTVFLAIIVLKRFMTTSWTFRLGLGVKSCPIDDLTKKSCRSKNLPGNITEDTDIVQKSHDIVQKSNDFYQIMNSRRTVRFFSKDHVPLEIIENIIKTAGTAPGMDDSEPWTFVVVAKPEMKKVIRQIVEEDEEINYNKRMGEKWVKDLKKLRTSWIKSYLEDVPYLIIILKQMYTYDECGRQIEHHNNELSTGIASGFLLTALHKAGLATVTSTPLNVGPTLRKYLGRPDNEKIILLLAVGYPSSDCTVPDLKRKDLSDIMILYE